ncbi:superoxide dismutase family protein [Gramella sp. GC03-9]|uniref:Superoxide dismutase family protein n=1 Tax=Christiangramia oceanisediminis TaxID=2920386 RepID=A0A9X2I2L0_9FLAO|nr:superoxide dismutase family protein [Gramella oceanisediminis]MCP9199856.1 superoxide dismutase family protein [Gramella oceanisediminis]
MKKINHYLAFCAVFALLIAGCSKDDPGTSEDPISSDTAVLQLGPVLNDMQTRQEQEIPDCSEEEPAFAQVVLEYGDGPTLVETVIPIGEDDQGLFTLYSPDLEIPIPSGETSVSVTLLEFVVWTDDGTGNPGDVIWVAPIEGSEFADFVDQPVGENFIFDLRAGSKNYVNVDVICYDDRNVNLYGYQFFTITPVPLIEFCFFGNYCTPEGRHYVASYSISVWYSEDGQKGELIYDGLENNVVGEGNDAYADPLCFFLPDRLDIDDTEEEYYIEIRLLPDTPGYNGAGELVGEGPISVDEIKAFFGPEGTLDYYHFQYGCEDGVPPPFGRPEAMRYKACLKYIDSADETAGYAYISVEGTVAIAVVQAFGLKPGVMHPQHIHTNASCDNPGGVEVPLDYNEGGFPVPEIGDLGISFMNYAEAIPGFFLQNVEDRTVVVHGKDVNGEYSPSTPVLCGELEEY